MENYKEQHYVPQRYFKLFSQSGNVIFGLRKQHGQLHPILKKNQTKPQELATNGQCKMKYFYGGAKIENRITMIEKDVFQTLESINKNGKIYKIQENTVKIAWNLQNTRTLRYKKYINQLISHYIIPGFPISHSKEFSEKQFLSSIDTAINSYKIMNHIEVSLITNNTDVQFLFSDCPATQWNAVVKKFGRRNVGAIMMYPISPKYLVFFHDKNCYEIPKNILIKDRKIIDELNFYQLLNALNMVYVSTENNVAYARALWDENALDYTTKHGMGIMDYHLNLPFLKILRAKLDPNELDHYPILTGYKKEYKLSGNGDE